MEVSFSDELSSLINKYSIENSSNTPDFILANFLIDCLKSYEKTSNRREEWFGRKLEI